MVETAQLKKIAKEIVLGDVPRTGGPIAFSHRVAPLADGGLTGRIGGNCRQGGGTERYEENYSSFEHPYHENLPCRLERIADGTGSPARAPHVIAAPMFLFARTVAIRRLDRPLCQGTILVYHLSKSG